MNKELPIPKCFDNPADAAERLVEMFVDIGQARDIKLNPPPAQRAVFRKLHGVAHGWLERRKDMPKDWQVGIFAHKRLAAWMRFSSDTGPTDPDLGSMCGIGLKLFGVKGENALGEAGETADLILQNIDRFFLNTAKTMVEFTYAGVVQRDYDSYLAKHPDINDVLNDMNAPRGSCLTNSDWAILPFHLGEEIVKYLLVPETPPEDVPDDSNDYLKTDLTNRLAERDYRFTLELQRRTNPATMPLDAADAVWSEEESPYVPVATLVIPRQRIDAPGQADYGQNLSFNIWRVPPANRPSDKSTIAVVRRSVYAAGAAMRQRANGQLTGDPAEPRTVEADPLVRDDCIVQAVIHPAIGIARVGTSDEYFFGPEVTDPPPLPPGSYRDKDKRLKRQAARFRIYGVNARGEIVRELTGQEPGAMIEWTVELANQKAAWYGFQLALDIPEANYAPPTTLRNPGVADRRMLAITPKPQVVKGAKAKPKKFTGAFMDIPVYLGEAMTDAEQRLTVLGGKGVSASANGSAAITFANNEGWYDDVADGPVTARVTLNGEAIQVIPAWVVVAPPNYGPQRKSVRTMWDLMRDVAIKGGTLAAPTRPSFAKDILPIFQRMAGLQWVNAGFAAGFGWEGVFDLTSPAALARLGSTSPAYREQRRVIYNNFRNFDVDANSPVPWPWLYGDAMNIPPVASPRQNSVLSDCQMALLWQWSEGNFDADHDSATPLPADIDQVPVAQQGEMLNQANEVLLRVGEKAGSGVTRTSKKFLQDIPESRFLQKGDRLPVLLDLCAGIACLHACELLALLRNSLVRRINLARGITSLGCHFAAFDAFYFIWKADTGRGRIAPALTPTARAKAARGLTKLTLNFATMGAVEFLGTAYEIKEIIEEIGWAGEGAIDIARERATEGAFEKTVKSTENFVKRFIHPRLDERLLKAIQHREAEKTDAVSVRHCAGGHSDEVCVYSSQPPNLHSPHDSV